MALRRGVDIVVGTTGRISDFMESGTLQLHEVKYFVCDEADRMLDMGFLPSVNEILSKIPKYVAGRGGVPERRVFFFNVGFLVSMNEILSKIPRVVFFLLGMGFLPSV
jgi:superfamily II DNA/RNA helicase